MTPLPPRESSGVTVRVAVPSDNLLLADMGARTFSDAFGAQNDPADLAAYLRAAFGPDVQAGEIAEPDTTFLIAEIDGKPVGYTRLRRGPAPASVPGHRRIELARLYAETGWIGKGVGKALVERALAIASAEGFETMWLSTWDVNHRGIEFYEKWGFEIVGEQDFVVGTDVQHDLLLARAVKLARVANDDDRRGSEGATQSPLVCPVCGDSLELGADRCVCPAGHSYDVAREGYVNLLVSRHRTRGIEGDTAEMLRSRRRFLGTGHYAPLRDLLAERVAAALAVARAATQEASSGLASPGHVLEVGCGEGYYVGGIAESLGGDVARGAGAAADAHFLGMDVSKAAVRLAARRYPSVTFFVGDVNKRVYVTDGQIDVLLDVFAPRNPAEFARVLRPRGSLLVAIPGQDHLASLRAALGLLSIEEDKEAKVVERLSTVGFRLGDRQELRYEMQLSAQDVRDLVAMGPNQWHDKAPADGEAASPMVSEASFVVLTLVANR